MTVTLTYDVDPGIRDPGPVGTRIQNDVDIDRGELEAFGALAASTTVTLVNPGTTSAFLRVTVQVEFTAAGNANFPTNASKIALLRNFYTNALAMLVPSRVTAATPVVS